MSAKEQENNLSFRKAVKKEYGGKYVVLGWKNDAFFTSEFTNLNWSEELRADYGRAHWWIAKV